MRLLVLSNTPFLPATAGNRERIRRMLEFLGARGVELGMLLLPAGDRPTWDVPGMRARVARLEIAEPPSSVRLMRRVRHMLGVATPDEPAPDDLDAWCPPWFRARAAALARAWRADVVLAEYVFLSAALEGVPAVRVVDTHDIMHRRERALAAAGLPATWFRTTAAEEARGLARADLVLAIQEEEAAVFRGLVPPDRVMTVPHAAPVVPAPPAAARPARLLFVGSYNELNVAGLRGFLDATWPSVRAAVSDVELVVCGNIAEKLGPMPAGVVLRGVVSDLAAEYAAARLVVSPVGGGTGLKVKLVEALCHGRPVVTSTTGAVGLETGDAAGVVVADEPAACAAAIAAILGEGTRFERLAAAAAAQAIRRFSPEAAFGPFLARLEERVRAQPRPA